MSPTTRSYAQSLRVIGQALEEALGIDSFELDKTADVYIVRMERAKSAGKLSWEERFLKAVAEKIWGAEDSAKKILNPLLFASSDIDRLDTEGRSKRGEPNAMPDARNLSLGLRALGDFLDRKEALGFTIRWSTQAVAVSYETSEKRHRQESFKPENLYDHGVRMYLRRSDRSPARRY